MTTNTNGSLEQWIEYKRAKAVAFVEAGYSVEWFPDAGSWIEVYRPEQRDTDHKEPGIHAGVKFCLEGNARPGYGRIYNLEIARIERAKAGQADTLSSERERLFLYDRGAFETNGLSENPEARKLHDLIVKELR